MLQPIKCRCFPSTAISPSVRYDRIAFVVRHALNRKAAVANRPEYHPTFHDFIPVARTDSTLRTRGLIHFKPVPFNADCTNPAGGSTRKRRSSFDDNERIPHADTTPWEQFYLLFSRGAVSDASTATYVFPRKVYSG